MIRSMTGFAAVGRESEGARVNVTVKSVNHRFLDVALKAPAVLASMEAGLRALVPACVSRGRVEVAIALDLTTRPDLDVVLDEGLLDRVAEALGAARARGVDVGPITASDLLRVPQLLEIRTRPASSSAQVSPEVAALVEAAVTGALAALVDMRETEGRHLAADLDARLGTMIRLVDRLEHDAHEGQAALEARLRERLAQLPPDLAADPAALAQETVRHVARSDVAEEIVRLRGHVEHWQRLAAGPEPCGRKLDFLVQEMNREVNTIGSKIEGPDVTEVVIDAKAELERMREQVQNVE